MRPFGGVKVRHSIPDRFTLAVRKAVVNGTMPLARIYHETRFFLCQTTCIFGSRLADKFSTLKVVDRILLRRLLGRTFKKAFDCLL
uniref:Uncharacterized protein n=1 Tax=Daphnia galeata TaxID=27404 RepID=A0A8J2RN70_9CRUS|nr:unnamed protein product [Daphnia galeata]